MMFLGGLILGLFHSHSVDVGGGWRVTEKKGMLKKDVLETVNNYLYGVLRGSYVKLFFIPHEWVWMVGGE